jgi:hypothetical protein
MAAKKKKKTMKKQRDGLNNKQIVAIVLFFVNVLLFAFATVKGENLWLALHNFMMGIGGFWIFSWLLFSATYWLWLPLINYKEKLGVWLVLARLLFWLER